MLKLPTVMRAGLASAASFATNFIIDTLILMLAAAAIGQWLGSTFLESLLPPGFDDITGVAFTIAQVGFEYELSRRRLVPIEGVEFSMAESAISIGLALSAVTVKAVVGNLLPGLIALVVLDAVALIFAVHGLKSMIKIAGRGANFVKMWYPLLAPVTFGINALSIATAATALVSDAGKLNKALHPA